jgi:HTH-type transcriptional regulator, competence development regulator
MIAGTKSSVQLVGDSFGKLVRQKRHQHNYSQRELAKLIGINYTYLSKLESDRADYPPSEKVIELLATHLELNIEQLRRLAGRPNAAEARIFQELYRQYPQMPKLLRRMANDPDFTERIIALADRLKDRTE